MDSVISDLVFLVSIIFCFVSHLGVSLLELRVVGLSLLGRRLLGLDLLGFILLGLGLLGLSRLEAISVLLFVNQLFRRLVFKYQICSFSNPFVKKYSRYF